MKISSYEKRFGDRKEGRRIRSLSPLQMVKSYIMPTRNDACNQFADSLEVSEAEVWLRQKRKEGYKGIGLMHVFIATYVRVIAELPGINRFIAGQRIYARHDIEINMMVLRTEGVDAEETCAKVVFSPSDTIYDVYNKMNAKIEEIRVSDDSGTENVAGIFMKLPSLLLKFVVAMLRVLDYFGAVPQALLDVSPFHGSMIITDLGSLGIPPIHHHIYNFGNLPIFISLGAKRKCLEIDANGQPVTRKYVDYTVVSDERICNGQYFSRAFRLMNHYLRNIELLETPPKEVKQDIF